MMRFNPTDWYWQLPNSQVYSSKRMAAVSTSDADFAAWRAQGGVPSICPDATGALTIAAIQAVLTAYGVSTASAS